MARTIDADPEAAKAVLEAVEAVGVDLDDVGRRLEDEGVASFEKSFDELLGTLGDKVDSSAPDPSRSAIETAPSPNVGPMFGELVVVDSVAAEFAERVIEAFLARPSEFFSLALSGGQTARTCYESLADAGGAQIDWWRVDVYWGDERCVPLDHEDSNYRLGREALLENVGAVNANYPMRCEDGPDRYHQLGRRAGPVRRDPPRPRRRRPHGLPLPGLRRPRRRSRSPGGHERGPERGPTPTPGRR